MDVTESSEPSRGIVVLVHGFNKKARDMRYLESELDELGWTCLAVNLPTLFADLSTCVEALHQQLQAMAANPRYQPLLNVPVHFVCHSMGGLIVRQFIHQHWQSREQNLALTTSQGASTAAITPGHCVFIATPHRGSRLADYAALIPGYKRTIKPINVLLPDAGYQRLPAERSFKLGVIAGTKSAGLFGRMLPRPNDGHVEVKAVRADDADAFIELPYHHKEIHHRQQTSNLTHTFLLHGQWRPGRD